MTIQMNCPDCGAKTGDPHNADCDVERCSVCGQQRITCDCEGHDPMRSAWTGEWPLLASAPVAFSLQGKNDKRLIELKWWIEPRLMRLYIGDVSIHDLWTEEVEAMVQDLEGKWAELDEDREFPKATPLDLKSFFADCHQSDPQHTLRANYYGEDDECGNMLLEVEYLGVMIGITEKEGREIARQFRQMIETSRSKHQSGVNLILEKYPFLRASANST